MPFTAFGLHPDLLKGIRELGFIRPTPIQEQAIPPALEGRDLLACAMTGSGKTAAFLLPILHRLIGKTRRTTRVLILTPTRELAAQILEDINALAVHTPLTGAAVYGGVSMGPLELLTRKILQQALVFTRTKHRANRLADFLVQHGIKAERIHGNRSQSQRTQALAGFKSGRYPVLVATDIAARGIDVEALSHVVNFDVPAAPDDYIHRVGRTGRAEMTGEAFTFVTPQDEGDWRAIERAIGKSLPRVTLPDFNYHARAAQLEV